MRKLNSVLGIVLIALMLFHIIVGAFQLMGFLPGGNAVMKTAAWIMLAAAALHTLIGIKLTFDTVYALKRSGKNYFGENKLFWIRRISGFALLVFMAAHVVIFVGHGDGSGFRLNFYDIPELVCSLLFVCALLVHIVFNIRPLMTALGASKAKEFIADAAFILTVLLLFAGAAFAVYFVRWQL